MADNLPTNNREEQFNAASRSAERTVSQAAESIQALSTETDRATSLLGFGRRIWVPADEVHVVVGHGVHITRAASEAKVFGQAGGQPVQYRLNPRTKVIKLKTISFTVRLHGPNGSGISALDANNVSFTLWAHAVAQLDPTRADVAARRIGQDTEGLVRTISQVAMSELIEASAAMTLNEIIANRQGLARAAFDKVNGALSELGYDLSVLTVTQLGGDAYSKLIQQAEARISKETTITINREQLAEQEDVEIRTQRETQIEAETKQKQAAVDATTTAKLVETARAKQKAQLEEVGLNRALEEAQAEKSAALARQKAEYDAEIRALEMGKELELDQERSKREAERMALEQAKKIERDAQITEAEADRLRNLELAAAQRAKEVALLKERETAEAYELQANAEARALAIKTEAETNAALRQAEVQAASAEQLAKAALTRAEATKAETAAAGLAEVQVSEARLGVAEKEVEIQRAEGLAGAEISRAQAEADALREERLKQIDIAAQKELASLYEAAPILVDLEKLRMQLEHDKEIVRIQSEASLRAFEAIAPGIKVNVVGGSGQLGEIMSNLLAISKGLNIVGDEIPAVRALLGHDQAALQDSLNRMRPSWEALMPSAQGLLDEMNPRIFSTLTISDLLDRLGPVVAGKSDLVTAVNTLRQDASFNVVGNFPIGQVMNLFSNGSISESEDEEIIVS